MELFLFLDCFSVLRLKTTLTLGLEQGRAGVIPQKLNSGTLAPLEWLCSMMPSSKATHDVERRTRAELRREGNKRMSNESKGRRVCHAQPGERILSELPRLTALRRYSDVATSSVVASFLASLEKRVSITVSAICSD